MYVFEVRRLAGNPAFSFLLYLRARGMAQGDAPRRRLARRAAVADAARMAAALLSLSAARRVGQCRRLSRLVAPTASSLRRRAEETSGRRRRIVAPTVAPSLPPPPERVGGQRHFSAENFGAFSAARFAASFSPRFFGRVEGGDAGVSVFCFARKVLQIFEKMKSLAPDFAGRSALIGAFLTRNPNFLQR